MYPMIISVEEVVSIKKIVAEVAKELENENIPYEIPEQGRMIEMTIQGAHKHGKWVGICGELGADTTLTERFIKMGIDELSVSPSMVLGVRSRICEME